MQCAAHAIIIMKSRGAGPMALMLWLDLVI
jgi:hypothetical protein